jgi:uncharacterized repeat protein (TIGR01451 family)
VILRSILTASLLAGTVASASANLAVTNADAAGTGLNDPTPAIPVGGNTGTTLGSQRLAVFQEAARLWGQVLDSGVTINILASFQPLTCDATSGVLGHASSPNVYASGSSGIPFPQSNTWYVAAQTERYAGRALLSGTGTTPQNYEIVAVFNSSIGTSSCLGGVDWYYGFDGNHGQKLNLLSVVLHEFGHGLGFSSFVDPTTGKELNGQNDIWSHFLFDEGSGKHWVDLDDSGRLASLTSGTGLAWDGSTVKSRVPTSLEAALVFTVTSAPQSPNAVKDYLNLAPAEFGAIIGTTPVSAPVKVASPSDACTASGALQPLTGALAIVDRGPQAAPCSFVEKARNVQAAGAVGILIANYTTGLVAPGGNAPDVTIPVLGITQADGATLKTAVAAGPVSASLRRDVTKGYAGADTSARAFMYAPNQELTGSSLVHWDTSAAPPLLMEPVISPSLGSDLDLTVPLLTDIGWFLVDVSVTAMGPSTLASGATGSFTFTVTNPGPSTASAVTLTNATNGVSFVSNSGDCVSAFPCTLGDIPPKTSRVVTSMFRASTAGPATTSVTVASPSNYNTANDVATVAINGASPGGGSPDGGTTGGGATGGCSSAGNTQLPMLALLAGLALLSGRRVRA